MKYTFVSTFAAISLALTGTAMAQSQSANNTSQSGSAASVYNNSTNPKQAPGAIAPGLTASGATCHAVLADGPQPYATYVENKDSLENNLITLQNKYNQVVSIALSNGVILPPELTFDIKVEYDAELLAFVKELEDVVNYMNNDRNEDGILVEKAVKYLKVLMVRQ